MDQRPNAIAGYFALRRDLIALLGGTAVAGPLTGWGGCIIDQPPQPVSFLCRA